MSGLFVHIYILGLNFNDIIKGFGIVMIVLGSADFLLNTLALVSDLIHHSRTKNKLVSISLKVYTKKYVFHNFHAKFIV